MFKIKELNTSERKLILFVVSMWGLDLFTYGRVIVERLPLIGSMSNFFIPITIFVLIVYSFKPLSLKIDNNDYVMVLALSMCFFLHMAFFPANLRYLEKTAYPFFVEALPFLFVGLVFDAKKHLPYMEIVSSVIIITGLAYIRFKAETGILGEGDNIENMARAYAYLPHCLLLLYTTLTKFNLLRLILLLISVLIILGTGNRGSLVVIVVNAVLVFVLLTHFKKNYIIKGGISFLALLLLMFRDSVLNFLYSFIEEVGLSNRALLFLMGGDFISDSNGRDTINYDLMNSIANSPFFGYGLCGDRVILGGTYSHNVALEFLISFGPFIGVIALLLLIGLMIKSYFACRNLEDKGLWLMLFGCGFLVLFISDSFLLNKYFYMMLGFCISLIRVSYIKSYLRITK